jgi:hypothetical protein
VVVVLVVMKDIPELIADDEVEVFEIEPVLEVRVAEEVELGKVEEVDNEATVLEEVGEVDEEATVLEEVEDVEDESTVLEELIEELALLLTLATYSPQGIVPSPGIIPLASPVVQSRLPSTNLKEAP